jgi:hypothetical protein
MKRIGLQRKKGDSKVSAIDELLDDQAYRLSHALAPMKSITGVF